MSLVNPIGAAIGPALGGFLQEFAGYGPSFLFSALLGLVGFLCTQLVREQRREHWGSLPMDGAFWSFLGSPKVRSLAWVMFLVGLAFGTQTTFVALLIQEAGAPLNPGLFYTSVAFASFGVRLLTGRASDRYGRGPFISLSLVTYALAMGILIVANSSGAFLAAGVAVGCGFGTLIPLISALVADRSEPAERGRLFSLVMCGFDLGIGLAGPLLGTLAAGTGYRAMFGYAALLSLASLGSFLSSPMDDRGTRCALLWAWGRIAFRVVWRTAATRPPGATGSARSPGDGIPFIDSLISLSDISIRSPLLHT
jgi:Arabinose efflux permease